MPDERKLGPTVQTTAHRTATTLTVVYLGWGWVVYESSDRRRVFVRPPINLADAFWGEPSNN